jgi:hypothetical protein
VGVSEAITHEVGHTLLLAHDGTSTASYYTGHDSADTPGWAPIMGVGYYQPVSQWSQQEYFDANNNGNDANFGYGRDDIAIISSLTNGNNFGLKSDDHGDAQADATAITQVSSRFDGIIETRQDLDVFSFTTATTGVASFTASVAAIGPNLDIEISLKDSSGSVVASANTTAALDASISTTIAPGAYTVEIDGRGVGSPSNSTPTGYTDYGSIGQYSLEASIEGLGQADVTPPAAPTGLAAVDGTADLTWTANIEPDLYNYEVRYSATTGGSFSAIGTTTSPSFSDPAAGTGSSYYVVVAIDLAGNISAESAVASVFIDGPSGTITNATGETPVAGSLRGTFNATLVQDGNSQTITEVESGGKPSKRHDLAEHRWSIPAGSGNQTLTVVASATDGGDADDGFSIEWSDNGSVWLPLATVRAGSPVDNTFAIGGPTGTVWVRVIDTNRGRGQREFDSVSVDFLQVEGDGDPVTPVDSTQAFASLATSQQGAGKGSHYGVATVSVIDDQGNSVAGASVTVQFSGDFNETVSGTTNDSGIAALQTSNSARKPAVVACVSQLSITGLTWERGSEAC